LFYRVPDLTDLPMSLTGGTLPAASESARLSACG
jgi:hypothetical protein